MNKEITKNQSLTVMKRKTTTAVKVANELTIDNEGTMIKAVDGLSVIKQLTKLIKKDEKTKRDPLNAELADISKVYKPIRDDLETGERIIKDKMLDYQTEVDAKREEKEAKLRARVDRGTMKDETADRKIDELGEAEATVDGNIGSTSFKTVRVVKVTDVTKVPAEYLQNEGVIDAVRKSVKANALDGMAIPGVEVVTEKQVASR